MACILYYFGITRQEIVGEVIAVAYEFPRAKAERTGKCQFADVPDWAAVYVGYQRIKMSTSTVLFREGA